MFNKYLGQYFTTNETLLHSMLKMIKTKPNVILEPSAGRGDIIKYISAHIETIFDAYEIDDSIIPYKGINITYTDFLSVNITKKYTCIIGNPPYIQTKQGNIYLEFIDKCFDLLVDNGELIFIIPSGFLKLTSASTLINKMMSVGTITDIYHPNNEKLFLGASIDVIIMRYEKTFTKNHMTMYNDILKHTNICNGMITFSEELNTGIRIGDLFDIYVGIVSGKESVFKNDKFGNITVLNGTNDISKYILIDKFPTQNTELNEYMNKHKDELINRKIRKFTDKNWYEWGALRNVSVMKGDTQQVIYIHTLTRKEIVSFIHPITYFGGGLLMMKPKSDINLEKVIRYLNTSFRKNSLFSGRFKIGQKQLCDSFINSDFVDIN